jgi:phosphoglucomutase
MISIELADGRRIAVRPSGTEPKIKFYMFGSRLPMGDKHFTQDELATIAPTVKQLLEDLWTWVQSDVAARLA